MNKTFLSLINNSKTIALFSHINPDADAIGSLMAMYHYLKDLGKEVYVFLQEPFSSNYNYMGIRKVVNGAKLPFYDLTIGVDCPSISRFGIYEKEFKKGHKHICIDHHLNGDNYGELNIVFPEKCSTTEILFDLFVSCNIKITSQIATCLYSGIAGDTGCFMHNNTNQSSFVSAGKLIDLGADIESVNYRLFVHKNFNEFDIFRKGLNNIEFYEDGKIAIVSLTAEMLKSANADANDTFLIIDFIKGIHNVDIAVLMSENKVLEQKVSVRTNKSSAQAICSSFGGGGHYNASGCRIFLPFEKAKAKLVEECRRHLIK